MTGQFVRCAINGYEHHRLHLCEGYGFSDSEATLMYCGTCLFREGGNPGFTYDPSEDLKNGW